MECDKYGVSFSTEKINYIWKSVFHTGKYVYGVFKEIAVLLLQAFCLILTLGANQENI